MGRRVSLIIWVIILLIVFTGCNVNTGISSLDKATSAVMKAEGELSLIEELIENHNTKPVKIKTIEKKLNGINQTIKDTEDYVIDTNFAERHERMINRYEEVKKEFSVLKEAEEKIKEKEKEKPEDSNG